VILKRNIDIEGIGMTSKRTRMRLVERLRAEGIRDLRVLEQILETPRHIFIDEALAHRAYEDTSLPIGFNQTISQPYIVARMTELLVQEKPLNKVLEVGTGCGYQTAVLAPLVGTLYSVERIKPLQDKAKERIRTLGIRNVYFRHADGTMGLPEIGPFDGIIVAAAPAEVPPELLSQLADGGCMVIPVGQGDHQELRVIRRQGADFLSESVETVRFVPMLGGVIR